MSFVNLPYRLAALRSITAAQVQAMYQAVADVLNGNIDGRNFSKRARIPNALKAEPYGIFGVTVATGVWWSPNGGVAGTCQPRAFLRLPGGAGDLGTLRLVGWAACFGRCNDANLAKGGSIASGNVRLKRDGAQIDVAAISAGRSAGILASRAVDLDVSPGAAGTVLEVALEDLVFNAPAAGGSTMTATLWLKAKHVR